MGGVRELQRADDIQGRMLTNAVESNGNELQDIAAAVARLDLTQAEESVRRALRHGLKEEEILSRGVVAGMGAVGNQFERGAASLLELQLVGELAEFLFGIITPHMRPRRQLRSRRLSILMATVYGDLHDLGRNLVGLQLRLAGHHVTDLGVNRPATEIIEAAQELNADVIGLSSLLVTTMPRQAEVIERLEHLGLRRRHRVIVGGRSTSRKWAQHIGADAWAPDGASAAEAIEALAIRHG